MCKRLVLLFLLGGVMAGCQSMQPSTTQETVPAEPADQMTADIQEPLDQAPAAMPVTNAPVQMVEESQPKTAQPKEQERNKIMILMKTSMGDIKIELDKEKAPKTVANFLGYVEAGHYTGTIFHRVINGFMIQGGGFDEQMGQKPAPNTVENEANNGLANDIGTIAMARTSDPHSAGAQFFINVKDNDFLNFRAETVQGWGYCVFGKVVEGMDVVNAIKTVPTGNFGHYQDVPRNPIVIESVEVIDE